MAATAGCCVGTLMLTMALDGQSFAVADRSSVTLGQQGPIPPRSR
jgi:hypothetical protein